MNVLCSSQHHYYGIMESTPWISYHDGTKHLICPSSFALPSLKLDKLSYLHLYEKLFDQECLVEEQHYLC
jgi:hypothetical protein